MGYLVEYHDIRIGRCVSYAEPLVGGKVHGLAKQFDSAGRLVMVSPFVRGTGTDFWCDDEGQLAEEHPIVRGRPSGCERWWNPDQRTVFIETHHRDGLLHGISREWAKGRLRNGFPMFFINGERVTKRRYLAETKLGAPLPVYRAQEDQPARRLPTRFLELKRRASHLRTTEPPTPRRKFKRPVSEEPIVLGQVIAERRYQVGSEWILVQIGTPHRTTWRSDFYCPVRIVGRETKLRRAFGIDSVQALILALELARQLLEAMRPPVYWFAGERLGDAGIDKRICTGLGIDYDKMAAELVEDFAVAGAKAWDKAHRRQSR